MNGHTKGPWEVSADGCTGDRTFRFLVTGPHFGPGEKAQAVDDARLIAAAPALLEACRDAEQHYAMICEAICADNPPPGGVPILTQLRAAIAAAEGR